MSLFLWEKQPFEQLNEEGLRFPLLAYVSTLSFILPVAFTIFLPLKRDTQLRLFIGMICTFSFVLDAWSWWNVWQHKNTVFQIGLYQAIIPIPISYFLMALHDRQSTDKAIRWIHLLCIILFPIEYMFFHNFSNQSILFGCYSVIIIIDCLYLISLSFQRDFKVYKGIQSPHFWLFVGLITSYSLTMVLNVLTPTILSMDKSTINILWSFQWIANILSSIIFSIAIWKTST
jgi:hypothetical protein